MVTIGDNASSFKGSYCFNRDCKQPLNPEDSDACQSCGASLLLRDRYRLVKLIGQGGFGRTFKARDESQASQPHYAIKQLWVSENSNPEKATELFQQEARRLEVLGEHPQIPRLQDYFVEEGEQYLVQEFIAGENLATELNKPGNWSEGEIKQLLNELLPLLRYIHSHQVIHRDIKPENIIRGANNKLFIVDFGAAKSISPAVLAKTGTVIGSAAYTAPEQLKGKAVYSSDLYSLAVTSIHLLTKVHPFNLFDDGENSWNWRSYTPQPVSKQLGKVLDKMLAFATKKRYSSASAAIKDLQPKAVSLSPRQIVGVSAAVILSFLGTRALISPVARQVSQPSLQQPGYLDNTPANRDSSNIAGLYATDTQGKRQNLPLQHTSVDAEVAGNLASVEVTQTFSNAYSKPIEAVYQFPLPDDAAVDEMEIRIGDRIIKGNIKKRAEAQQIYQQAKKEGKTAGLLEQQRDNIFTQSVANIQPGEAIEVAIRYTNTLQFIGGDYEFAFPLVVAPRYEGGNVGNNLLISPAVANEIPKTRSGKDIDFNIEIDAGMAITEVQSLSHSVAVASSNSTTSVSLAKQEIIPNQDLILRYQVAGADTQATVLTQNSQQGGHFATYLIPAVEYDADRIVPKDVIFLMDTSGSQRGAAIQQSKELMRQFINGLNPEDTFNIIDFSSTTQRLSDVPLANTRQNRSKALGYVNRITANGGTELMNGINTVIDFPEAEDGRLRSIVLLSDGLIGADEEVIGRIRDGLKPGNRLYSFGVGHSSNRFVLNRLAELGRGTATILPIDEDATEVAEKFYREINKPVVTNIEMEWLGEGEAPEIYPRQAPDLFASQPLVLYGRKSDRNSGQLKITGTVAGGERYEQVLDVNFQQVGGNSAIAQLWGRSRIKDLMNQMYGKENQTGIDAVTNTALDYNLLSKYTAFVAVDENPEQISQSLNSPEGELQLAERQQNITNPSSNYNPGNSQSVPEPSEIIGNLFALIALTLFLTRKRWSHLVKAIWSKNES